MESPSTDAQLVVAALSGRLSAFEALVVRHQDLLYLQALSYLRAEEDARDALQDAFLKAFRQLGTLKEPSRFPAWVGRILRNVCLNRLREDRRRRAMAESAAGQANPEEHAEPAVIRRAAFQELFAKLPEKSVRAFTLHYLEGRSIEDVALLTETTPSGVKQRLYRARRQLQEEVTRMARDAGSRQDLPEGFAARTIVRLLEQGRKDRLFMKLDEARTRFREALEVCPDHPEALVELGVTCDPIEGPSEDEAATIQRAAPAAPESIEAALAVTTMWSGDREKQAAAIEKCLDLCSRRLGRDPDNLVALTARAQMFLWKGDFEEMEEAARQAAAAAPEDQQCLNYLALSLARQDRWDEAYPVYEEIYGLNGKTVWAYVALRQMGTCLAFHRGDWAGAVKVQEKVWDLTGRPNEAGNLIYFYGRAGMVEKAKALFREVEDHPHPARVYEIVGKAKIEEPGADSVVPCLSPVQSGSVDSPV